LAAVGWRISSVTLNSLKRKVTFSLPEELVRDAKVYAAERDLSLDALVRKTLESVVASRSRRREAVRRLLRLAKC
jgi:hypothetical protein